MSDSRSPLLRTARASGCSEGRSAIIAVPRRMRSDTSGQGRRPTILGRRPSLDDVGNAAAFLSSDWARTMTATEVNLTAGSVVD